MPICKNCNQKFPNKTFIDGKEIYLHTRVYCLDCSPRGSKQGYELRKAETKKRTRTDSIDDNLVVVCSICSKKTIYKNKQSKHGVNKHCSTCRTLYQRHKKKRKAVDLLGGCCKQCGETDIDVLTFHHRDKEDKLFGISANYHARNWDLLLKEIQKCDLLCCNCHMKLHKQETKDKIKLIESIISSPVPNDAMAE